MADSAHGIYVGRVWHSRRQPAHRFDYRLFMLWLDLDELDALQGLRPWLGLERWALASIRRTDHLPGQAGSWRQAAEAQARQLGCDLPIQRIRVLCHARYLGCYFSPVNFYYLYGDDDAQPHSLLAEVSNTPWLQRHCYLVPIQPEPVWRDKSFHVSPFMPLAMRYRWQVGVPGEQLQLQLANYQQEQQQFAAGLQLHYQPLTRTNLKRLLLRTPAMTLKIIGGIYWQALRLWWRGARFYPYSPPAR